MIITDLLPRPYKLVCFLGDGFLGDSLGLGGIYIFSYSTGVEHSVTAVVERNIAADFFLVGVGGRSEGEVVSRRLRLEFRGVELLRYPPDELLGVVADNLSTVSQSFF